MRIQILLVLFLIVSIVPASAGIDVVDAGADMVKSGMDAFLIGIADNLYDSGVGIFNSSVSNASSTDAIFAVATYTYDPLEDPVIKLVQKTSALIYIIIMFMYILCGATGVLLARIKPDALSTTRFITGGATFGSYLSNIVVGICVALFTYTLIKLVLVMNYIITHLIMIDVLETVAPSVDNVVLYLMMAICYLVMNIFFLWRMLIIGIFTAFALVFGVMYVFDATKGIAKAAFSYFVSMVFLQSIICGVTSVGVRMVKGCYMSQDAQVVFYLSLICLLIIIATLTCLGIHRVLWGTKKVTQVILA